MVDKIGPILRPSNDDFIFTCEPYTELLKGEVTSSCRSPSLSLYFSFNRPDEPQASKPQQMRLPINSPIRNSSVRRFPV
jgi:hypothetical protein